MVQVFDPARHKSLGIHTSRAASCRSSVAELTAEARAAAGLPADRRARATGAIIGYEALVRPTPDSGFSNAGELFAAAEDSGRQAELDQACLEVVIAGRGLARAGDDSLAQPLAADASRRPSSASSA